MRKPSDEADWKDTQKSLENSSPTLSKRTSRKVLERIIASHFHPFLSSPFLPLLVPKRAQKAWSKQTSRFQKMLTKSQIQNLCPTRLKPLLLQPRNSFCNTKQLSQRRLLWVHVPVKDHSYLFHLTQLLSLYALSLLQGVSDLSSLYGQFLVSHVSSDAHPVFTMFALSDWTSVRRICYLRWLSDPKYWLRCRSEFNLLTWELILLSYFPSLTCSHCPLHRFSVNQDPLPARCASTLDSLVSYQWLGVEK